ncbi:MAG: MFS transporter [Gammaproteobacteria bacterium]
MTKPTARATLAWAFYDWANSAYAVAVMSAFFPIFFKEYWSHGVAAVESTFYLGVANSVASLVIVVAAPVLGAIADRGGTRKRILLLFATLGVAMTAALYWVAKGEWFAAAALYVAATVGFSGANVFYDSLLVSVAPEKRLDYVSALGYGLGYLGGGILFAICVFMTVSPQRFGLSGPGEAVRLSFIMVAVWWAVFSLPIFLWVPETRVRGGPRGAAAVAAGFRQLAHTFDKVRRLRVVFLFLVGYWLYIDGVDTIVRMAIDYGLSLHFDPDSLIVALLITQFVGFPAALAFGRLGERYGPKAGILIGIGVYIGVVLWAYRMQHVWEFYALAVVVGLVQGGVQSLSRSFYARIIPRDKASEFYGFYNMWGKFAAVLGPGMMGWFGVLTGSSRLAMLSIIVLFVFGAACLWVVDEQRGRKMAAEL